MLMGIPVGAAVVIVMGVFHASEPPPVFRDLSFTEARALAVEEGQLLVISASAEWCGPCKKMDRTTWVDDDVERWMKEHAIAIQIDVDVETDVARELEIRAMPTVVVYRGDEQFDRHVGYQDAPHLLRWLEGVREGKTSLDSLRETAGDRNDPGGRVDVRARMDIAERLADAGEYEDATEEYVWLWENMLDHDLSYSGVRGSFMASDMEKLAESSDKAKDRFKALRDETEARLHDDPTWDDLGDWIVLNEVIGDEDATLAWIDRNKHDAQGLRSIRRYDFHIMRLLEARGRWADYGMIVKNPVAQVRAAHQNMLESMAWADRMEEEDVARMLRANVERTFHQRASALHAGMLAAGREDEAWRVVEAAIDLMDDPALREAMVSKVVEIDQAREKHREVLRPECSEDIRRALNGALDE